MLRIVLLLISSAICLTSCKRVHTPASLPYYNTPDFTPLFLDETAADSIVKHTIASFYFHDQYNQVISDQDLRGKIHVANFFFCSCGSVCPGMMSNLQKVNDAFPQRGDIEFLSFSVTPWRDSISVLMKYADEHRIKNRNWHLLTGDRNEIYSLARKSYFAEEELGLSRDSSNFLHTEHVLLIDKKLRIRGIYNGSLPLEMDLLIRDIELLRRE